MAWNDSRPMSPHLQIYRLPLTAIISITHRITGVMLSAGLVLLLCAVVAAAISTDCFAAVAAVMSSWFGQLVLFGFTAALYVHFCNGIRHLFWDAGSGFDLVLVRKTNLIVLGASLGLTIITWGVALLAMGG